MMRIGLILVLLVVLVGSVSASLGVGSVSVIEVNPGETASMGFSLQNVGSEAKDLVLEGIIKEGEKYVEFVDGDRFFKVPAGEIIPAFLIIRVPDDAEIGDIYPVSVTFKPIVGGVSEGEMVDFAVSVGKSFNIKITGFGVASQSVGDSPIMGVEDSQGRSNFNGFFITFLSLIGVLIVMVLVIIVLMIKRNNSVVNYVEQNGNI